jgi:hypothetical protein
MPDPSMPCWQPLAPAAVAIHKTSGLERSPVAVFHVGSRGSSTCKVLLGPTITSIHRLAGGELPASLTATQGLVSHRINLVYWSLDPH